MQQGLESSRWAPLSRRAHHLARHETRSRSLPPAAAAPPPRHSPDAPSIPSPARAQAFHRLQQTCQRLRWKSIDLESSYSRALTPLEWGFEAPDAERNFKVDFHEFYAWIEQAVVFLLRVFGVAVHKGAGGRAGHSHHHDVLRALDREDGPLRATLGSGDVNHALWKAKELRNRWKDAAEGRETPPLKMYDLRWIVTQILGGLEEAYLVAGREVGMDPGWDDGEGEDGWEWMVESMDWEAD
ncbi:uncharacterized protein UV8b_00813 [Ustilaginoidea virens]|uniref:Fungal specific transcription factor n=1 Tax=Ustilaginoidea virens TaxID=1159556 RepID=A0A8E5HJS9_USTVR|nr:uncharacterized protein UV8b_00813 [Ustilaginoidea virens]QUC16572.1 hypothetical protein UV8b_00813 [Ustilaginoidea virens]